MLVLEQEDQDLYDRVQEKNIIRQYIARVVPLALGPWARMAYHVLEPGGFYLERAMAYGKVEKTRKIVKDMARQHRPKMGGVKLSKPMRKTGRGR